MYIIQVTDNETNKSVGFLSGCHVENGTLLVPDFSEEIDKAKTYETADSANTDTWFWENTSVGYSYSVVLK